MPYRLVTCALAMALAGLTWAATPKKAPAKKSSPAKAGAKKTTAKRPATTWRNRQTVPTSARYKEIQEALAAKGYLQPENATGVWTQTSIDALKRFQADQKITSTGKINSLSLIALGLGPKRDPNVKPPLPPAAQ